MYSLRDLKSNNQAGLVQCQLSFLPCLLPAVLDGSDTADKLPPTLLLCCLLLASLAFLAEFRMASVLKDAGLQGKNRNRNSEVISFCKPRWDECNKESNLSPPNPLNARCNGDYAATLATFVPLSKKWISKATAQQNIVIGNTNRNPYLCLSNGSFRTSVIDVVHSEGTEEGLDPGGKDCLLLRGDWALFLQPPESTALSKDGGCYRKQEKISYV